MTPTIPLAIEAEQQAATASSVPGQERRRPRGDSLHQHDCSDMATKPTSMARDGRDSPVGEATYSRDEPGDDARSASPTIAPSSSSDVEAGEGTSYCRLRLISGSD
ncbi:hypothetical protein M6B38_252995 [Iris pallida]|uniref:Uncharacterized protein n=1 Tax=Iris pallida TaxID=29817 RepID=A0AAX6IIS5_IRIPA|nr:hypothetical protein M6B38_252995 [Iris pallida]